MVEDPQSPQQRPERSLRTGGTGLAPNVAGALSYLIGVVTGVLFLVLDKDEPFVRFHASQSIVFSLAWFGVWIVSFVLDIALGAIPVIGWLVSLLLTLAIAVVGFVLWAYLMFRAYQGDEWELPFVGQYARKLAREATSGGIE